MDRPVAHPRLLIGLSPRVLRNGPPALGFPGKTLQYLEQSMAHWLMSLGALVVMLPTVDRVGPIRRSLTDVPDMVAALDGLMLQGGTDIDPRAYGEAPTHTIGPVDALRDGFELELLRAFVAAGKPVFGVCRGMQLINVAYGGTLHQDLNADGATTTRHVRPELYDQHAHALRIGEGTWLSAIHDGATTARVNSIHHQGIKTLGQGLVAEAWAEDGVIEAMRAPGAGFLVGVQWHPEFHDGRDASLLAADPLLQAFLDAAQAVRTSRHA